MNTAKRVAGILILLLHFIGGIGGGVVLVILIFASHSERSPDPYPNPHVYNYRAPLDPVAPVWFIAVAGISTVLIAGTLLYVQGCKSPRVAVYAMLLLPVLYVMPTVISIVGPGTPAPDAVTGLVKGLAALTFYSVIGSLFGIALISASHVQRQPLKVSWKN